MNKEEEKKAFFEALKEAEAEVNSQSFTINPRCDGRVSSAEASIYNTPNDEGLSIYSWAEMVLEDNQMTTHRKRGQR